MDEAEAQQLERMIGLQRQSKAETMRDSKEILDRFFCSLEDSGPYTIPYLIGQCEGSAMMGGRESAQMLYQRYIEAAKAWRTEKAPEVSPEGQSGAGEGGG